jgi:hypothetical protein
MRRNKLGTYANELSTDNQQLYNNHGQIDDSETKDIFEANSHLLLPVVDKATRYQHGVSIPHQSVTSKKGKKGVSMYQSSLQLRTIPLHQPQNTQKSVYPFAKQNMAQRSPQWNPQKPIKISHKQIKQTNKQKRYVPTT